MVVFDVDVEDVHRSVERCAAGEEVVDDGIPTALFACEDDVYDAGFCTCGSSVLRPFCFNSRSSFFPLFSSFSFFSLFFLLSPPLLLLLLLLLL